MWKDEVFVITDEPTNSSQILFLHAATFRHFPVNLTTSFWRGVASHVMVTDIVATWVSMLTAQMVEEHCSLLQEKKNHFVVRKSLLMYTQQFNSSEIKARS
jgi:hypothetical protein